MTRQEMFDTAAKHLLTQRTRSIDNDNYCQYRGTQGRMCAIGPMIPDEKYSPDMEGWGVDSCCGVWEAMGLDSDDRGNLEMLARKLQHIHDSSAPTAWPYMLLAVALEYNLDTAMVRRCADAMIREDSRFSRHNPKVQEP